MTSANVSASAASTSKSDAKKQSAQYDCWLDTFACFTFTVSNKLDKKHVFTIDDVPKATSILTLLDPLGKKLFEVYDSGETFRITDVANGETVMKGLFKGIIKAKLIISKNVDGHFLPYLTMFTNNLGVEYALTDLQSDATVASCVKRSTWTNFKWDLSVEPGYDVHLMSLIMLVVLRRHFNK